MPSLIEIIQKHSQWPAVEEIYNELSTRGYQVVLAGGCVRDALCGKLAHDLDVATNARPEEVEQIFARTRMVGRQFGVSVVLVGSHQIEVATFREDGAYLDGRHPKEIHYSDMAADARRRDFTVNALFFDLKNQKVVDFVQGQEDLKIKILRAVGQPEQRFAEDHLRLLRAIRFAAQLGFQIEEGTWKAIQSQAPLLAKVSSERICEELLKFFDHSKAPDIDLFVESGLLGIVFPEVLKVPKDFLRRWRDTFKTMTIPPLWGRQQRDVWHWTHLGLLYFLGGLDFKVEIKKWPLPNSFKNQICWVFTSLENRTEIWKLRPGARLLEMNKEELRYFIQIILLINNQEDLVELHALHSLFKNWDSSLPEFMDWKQDPIDRKSLPEPLIRAFDLPSSVQGAKIGRLLKEAYIEQLECFWTYREQALEWLQHRLRSSD